MLTKDQIRNNEDIHNNLKSLLEQERLDDAEKLCSNLSKQYNNNFYINYYLGKIAFLKNQNDESVQHLKTAWAIGSQDPIIVNDLGHMLSIFSDHKTALDCFVEANKLLPKDYHILFNLAFTYNNLSNYNDALKYYLQARSIENNSIVNSQIGLVYFFLHNTDKALDYLKEAIKIDPTNYDSLVYMARIYVSDRQINKATKLCNKIISLDKRKYYAYSILASIKKFDKKKDASLIKQLEDLLDEEKIAAKDTRCICFTLGKIYNEMKEYDKAFQYFTQANEIKLNSINYNRDLVSHTTRISKIIYTNNYISNLEHNNKCDTKSIFIVGMPRSGTTLTEQILNSHSNVKTIGESSNITRIISELETAKQTAYPNLLNQLNDIEIKEISNKHKKLLDINAPVIVDKMPNNILYVGFILSYLPNCVIINSKRHPLDIFLSIYCMDFLNQHMNYSYRFEDIYHYYKNCSEIMEHWKNLFPGRIYDSYYEYLVLNQEDASKKLISHCGLDWEDNCLNFQNSKDKVFTASSAQVQNKLYKKSMYRWKNYDEHLQLPKALLADEISKYQADLKKLLDDESSKL